MKFNVIIVGAGHAGAQAAIALSAQKFDGSIAIFGDEPDFPYERPPLSKEYFSGEKSFDRILLRPPSFWQDRQISMYLGERISSVDPILQTVTTEADKTYHYDKLIWATGGSPRKLAIPGGELRGIQGVRTRVDADKMKAAADASRQVVVIGGGYIGLEAAAVLTKLGKKVVLLEALNRVLARVAGDQLSRFLRRSIGHMAWISALMFKLSA